MECGSCLIPSSFIPTSLSVSIKVLGVLIRVAEICWRKHNDDVDRCHYRFMVSKRSKALSNSTFCSSAPSAMSHSSSSKFYLLSLGPNQVLPCLGLWTQKLISLKEQLVAIKPALSRLPVLCKEQMLHQHPSSFSEWEISLLFFKANSSLIP